MLTDYDLCYQTLTYINRLLLMLTDYHVQMLDFSTLDMSKLEKEMEEARERQRAIEAAMEPEKKKKRKKKKSPRAHVKRLKVIHTVKGVSRV